MTPYHPLFVQLAASASDVGSGAFLFLDGWQVEIPGKKTQKMTLLDKKIPVNQPVAHAQLIATYRRAEADAAHKFGLIQAVAGKGPKAIKTAIDTAAKAAKRRDAYAGKLAELGVMFKD